MSVKNYEKRIPVQAIQFQGIEMTHLNEIVGFVGLPISIEYTSEGISLRIIRNPLDVLVVKIGDFVVKSLEGKLSVMTEKAFTSEYQEVI